MRARSSSPQLLRYSDWRDSAGDTAISDPLLTHHEIEHAVWRELHSIPGVRFSSLIVRRTHNGLCLQGVMETDDDVAALDVDSLVRRVAKVDNVVNLLLVREPSNPSRIPR